MANQTLKPLFCLFLTSALMAQAPKQNDLRSKAEARIEAIEKRLRAVDKISAHGLRFKQLAQIAQAFESEIDRLNNEIQSSNCHEMAETFQKSKLAWAKFYDTERKHFNHLNDCLGTNNLEASHYALIRLLSSRSSYLASQLSDFERR